MESMKNREQELAYPTQVALEPQIPHPDEWAEPSFHTQNTFRVIQT